MRGPMLPLVLALLLGSADGPLAEAPAVIVPPPGLRSVAVEPRPEAFSTRVFPTMPISRFLGNIGSTLARPFRPQLVDALVIVPALIGTAIALNTDVASHALVKAIPDPVLGNKQLSYWVSFLGEGWVDVTLFLAIGLVGGRDGQRACLAGIQALVASAIASRVGKLVFRVERPSYDPDQQHFFSRPQADAMPAGHVMAAFASAAVLSQEYPKLAPVFFALAAWVGLARMQQNAHWLSDVIVGAALGTLFGWQSWKLTRDYELEVQPWAGSTGAGVSVATQF